MSLKRFQKWLNETKTDLGFFEATAGLVRLHTTDGPDGPVINSRVPSLKDCLDALPAGLERAHCERFYHAIYNKGYTDPLTGQPIEGLIPGWAMAGLLADGPKVFVPTADEFEALGSVELRVPVGDYRQPFHTFVLVIPEESYPADLTPEYGKPICAVTRFQADETGGLVSCVIVGTTDDINLSWRMAWTPGTAHHEIEEKLRQLSAEHGDPRDPDNNVVSPSEVDCVEKVKRVVLNAALLMTEAGFRLKGFTNPKFRDKCLDKAARKNLPAHVRAVNRRDAQAVPMLIGFDQHIKVYETSTAVEGSTGPGGWSTRPHWRRGHWHRVCVGKGRADRKKKFYPAVLVNFHLLGGTARDTRVTVTTGAVKEPVTA